MIIPSINQLFRKYIFYSYVGWVELNCNSLLADRHKWLVFIVQWSLSFVSTWNQNVMWFTAFIFVFCYFKIIFSYLYIITLFFLGFFCILNNIIFFSFRCLCSLFFTKYVNFAISCHLLYCRISMKSARTIEWPHESLRIFSEVLVLRPWCLPLRPYWR